MKNKKSLLNKKPALSAIISTIKSNTVFQKLKNVLESNIGKRYPIKNDSDSILKSSRFLPLFTTQFFGAFNDNAFKNSFLIWFTYDIAQKYNYNALMMINIASALFILPFFLFSAIAGQIADKYEKSNLVRIIKVAEILIMFFCYIGFYNKNIYLLLSLLFLMGMHSTFFGPIKYSLLPEHLKNNELIKGNGLIESGTFIAILLGTIFGGILIRINHGIEIVCLTIFICALIGFFSSIFIPKSKIADSNLKVSFNIFSQISKIITYAKKEESVWLSIIGISWFWFIGIAFLSQFPIYTKQIISGNEQVFTLFLAIFSIGIGIGSTICNKLLKDKITAKLVPHGCMGMTVGIALFCLASLFYQQNFLHNSLSNFSEFISNGFASFAIMFSLLIISLSAGIYIVPLYAIMQHRCEAKYLSRIISTNNIFNALFMLLSSLTIMLLIYVGLYLLEIFFIVGLVNIVVFFVIKRIRATHKSI